MSPVSAVINAKKTMNAVVLILEARAARRRLKTGKAGDMRLAFATYLKENKTKNSVFLVYGCLSQECSFFVLFLGTKCVERSLYTGAGRYGQFTFKKKKKIYKAHQMGLVYSTFVTPQLLVPTVLTKKWI